MRGQAVAQGAGWAAGRASPVRGGAVAGVGRRPCAASACMERPMPLPTARPTSPAMVAVSSGPLSKGLHWRPEGVCKLDGTAARRCDNQGAQCMLPAQFSLTRAACCPFRDYSPCCPRSLQAIALNQLEIASSTAVSPTCSSTWLKLTPGRCSRWGPPCCLRTVIDVPECHTAHPASRCCRAPGTAPEPHAPRCRTRGRTVQAYRRGCGTPLALWAREAM